MHRLLLTAALLLGTTAAQAEPTRIFVSEQAADAQMQMPSRGESTNGVRQTYGNPVTARGPVGNPPISIWSYEQFTVYFERDRVIHSVPHHKAAN